MRTVCIFSSHSTKSVEYSFTLFSLPRWARDKALSFVPPDGKFTLMEYRFGSSTSSISPGVTVPFALKSSVELLQGSANFELTLQPQSPSPKGLEMIAVEWYLGKGVSTASCIVTGNQSSYTFDARMAVSVRFIALFHLVHAFLKHGQLLRWQIAPATRSNTYILRGTFNTS
jgi:AP-3 complex subunit mu